MKPILFNTEMVRAILDGRKTTTRRIVKPQPIDGRMTAAGFLKAIPEHMDWGGEVVKLPYQPSDVLYVQETWKIDSLLRDKPGYPMAIDFKALQSGYSQAEIMCSFTPERFQKFQKFYQKPGWQSPYFMPKEAARIFLRVTDVKAEQLRNIDKYWSNYDKEGMRDPKTENISIAMQEKFISIWDSTIKKSDLDKYGWDANPWVWVYEFERCEKPKEEG